MPKAKAKSKSKKNPFDLSSVNPAGRVDVFAASLIDRLAATAPELASFVQQNRETIHAGLNEQFGPHVFDVLPVVQKVKPFMPFLEFAFQQFAQARAVSQQPNQEQSENRPAPAPEKPKVDYYAVLGVAKTATADEIRHAYRKLARKYHPDLNPGSKDAEARFHEVQVAYNALNGGERQAA